MSLTVLSQETREQLANMWKHKVPDEEISFLLTPGINREILKNWHIRIHTYIYDRYIFHNEIFQLEQDNGQLRWKVECLLVLTGNRKGENYSLYRWFDQGSCVREETEIPATIPKLDQELIRYYWIVLNTDHPLDYSAEEQNLQELSIAVSAYWAQPQPIFQYVACYPRYPGVESNTKFNISFRVEGVKEIVFVAVYDTLTQLVEWMEIEGQNHSFLGMLVHEEQLLTFIQEEAPCRLQLLFEKSC